MGYFRSQKGFGDDAGNTGEIEMPDDYVGKDAKSGTDLTTSAAGSTSITASDFVQKNGVCKPSNFVALAYAMDLQNHLNRVAQIKSYGKIAVDGSIGPNTLGLFKKVQAISAGSVMGDASSCINIAADADVLAAQVHELADKLGAPASVPGPSTGTVTVATASGHTVKAPAPYQANAGMMASISDALGGLSPTVILIGGAGALGLIYYLGKGSKKSRTPARRARTARRY